MKSHCVKCGEDPNKYLFKDEDVAESDITPYVGYNYCDNCEEKTWFVANNVGVPKKYANVTFGNYITQREKSSSFGLSQDEIIKIVKVKEKVQDLIEYISKGSSIRILFYGKPGTGKTLLATASINSLSQDGHTTELISANQLLYGCMDTENYVNIIKGLSDKTLVVIDDFTDVTNSDFTKRVMHDVIDGTYSNLTSLIITTNLTIESLNNMLSPGSLDRMNEGIGGSIFFNWKSFRK